MEHSTGHAGLNRQPSRSSFSISSSTCCRAHGCAGVIVGVSCAIIIIIFMAQRFGTTKLGASFAPIILIWFLFNVIVAIYNIVKYYPAIFKCFSPHWAYLFFKHNRHTGWEMLSGVFLAVTGAEATFADLASTAQHALCDGTIKLPSRAVCANA